MLPQKYPNDCGSNGLQTQAPLSPPPASAYLMNSSYMNASCAQFGSPASCMSPPVNSYGAIGSPGSNGGGQCLNGGGAGGSANQTSGGIYNGVSGMNSTGSCDNLSLNNGGGPSPGLQRSNSGSFRDASVISNGITSANSAAAAAAAAAAKGYRRAYTHNKPPYSYISLITMAINVSFFFYLYIKNLFIS